MQNSNTSVNSLFNNRLMATIFATGTLVSGCGSDTRTPETTAVGVAPAPLTTNGSCFLEAATTPCTLLTLNVTRETFPGAPESLEIEEHSSKLSSSCTVSWQGGRTNTIGNSNFSMEVDMPDSLTLSAIMATTEDRFATQHRNLSEAEKTQAAERVDAAIAEQVEDGTIANEHEEMGRDFAKSLINNVSWEPVVGVGDRAAWGGVGRFKTLDVMVGDAQFSVRADIANDDAQVREASILAAQNLIEQCEF